MGQSPPGDPPEVAWTAAPCQWEDWPLRAAPGRALAAGGLGLFLVLGIGLESVPLAVLAALLLFGATSEFYLPTTFTLDAEGAVARRFGWQRRLRWEEVARVAVGPGAVALQARGSRPWLVRRRSLLLRGAPPEVLAQLRPE